MYLGNKEILIPNIGWNRKLRKNALPLRGRMFRKYRPFPEQDSDRISYGESADCDHPVTEEK
jgi:hypothetical protein